MTVRNRWHSRVMINVGYFLKGWRDTLPEPRGDILGGEAGIRLQRNPDTTVGMDLAYVSAEVAARQTDETTLIDGVPILAVEILSPSDTVKHLDDMVDEYLQAGVLLVWVLDPHDRTVVVYRPGKEPELFNSNQELVGDPELPGFRVSVARLFE